jgi:hypothetical protein
VWFAGLFALRGFRYPVGPDGPVYLWWTRLAAVDGLSRVERPGAIALLGVLRWTGVGLPAAVAGVECALGVGVGLASAALARAGGASRSGWVLAGALAGTFASHLVAGYVSNLVFAALFVAAIVVLDGASRRAVTAAALLLGAGGLTHPPFFLVGVVVLLLAGALAFRSDRAETWRAVVASAGGGAILALGQLWLLAGPAVLRADTSQDAFLRRAGLTADLAHAYRDRLIHRWTRYVQWISVPLAAAGAYRPSDWIRRALWSWVAVTVAGVAIGAATGRLPPDRFITFGYAIPVLAAFGILALVERWRARRVLALAAAGAVVAAMLAGAGLAWLREKPYLGTQAVDDVALASRFAARTPPGTPWIFPVDSPSTRISFLATRLQNVIRTAVPPERIGDVYVVAPPPPPGLSETDRREWSALARLYAADAASAARRATTVVVVRVAAFDARGAGRRPVCSTGRPADGSSDVCAALDAPSASIGEGVSVSAAVGTSPVSPLDTTLDSSTALVVGAAPLVLAALWVAGLGWAVLVTRDRIEAAALAPAFGAAAVLLAAVLADRSGIGLSGAPHGLLVLALAGLSGYGLLAVERRRRRDVPP